MLYSPVSSVLAIVQFLLFNVFFIFVRENWKFLQGHYETIKHKSLNSLQSVLLNICIRLFLWLSVFSVDGCDFEFVCRVLHF